jgi:hypothetical protein
VTNVVFIIEIHYEAYKQMAKKYNVEITWTFEEYCLKAHFGEDLLAQALFSDFPKLSVRFFIIYCLQHTNYFFIFIINIIYIYNI